MNIETANRLVELRKQHNLSQEDLAEALGISRQAVSKWERAEASPDTDNLISLARLYAISIDELLGNAMPPAPVEENRAQPNPLARTGFPLWFVCLLGGAVLAVLAILWTFFFHSHELIPMVLVVGFTVCAFGIQKWRRRLTAAYPIFCVLIYLVCGTIFGSWHPTWLIFLTIPLFYTVGRG